MSFFETLQKVYNGFNTIDSFCNSDKMGKFEIGVNSASNFIENNQDKIADLIKKYKK